MKIRTERFQINISNLVFAAVPLIILTGCITEYLIAFVSAVLHETGHAAAARAMGRKPERLGVTPAGLLIGIDEKDLVKSELLLLFSAGPAASLLLAAMSPLVGSLFQLSAGRQSFFFYSNICLAVFNFIPAIPLDGGRILRELLSGRTGLIRAEKILRTTAFLLSACFIAAGVLQLAGSGINFSLLAAGVYIMILLFTGKMEGALMNIKQIIYRRSRLLSKGVYPARDLVALKSAKVVEILKNLDFDRFHFIYVLDENLKLIGIVNENEIMEMLSGIDSGITFEELLKSMEKVSLIDI